MSTDTGLVFRGAPAAEAVRRAAERGAPRPERPPVLDAVWLRDLCIEAGVADAGFVEIGRAALGAEADNARRLFPATRTLVSLVGLTNRDAIRSVSRATANNAWHHTGDRLDGAAHEILERLASRGVRGVATSVGFPMEMHPEPGRPFWEIAHKTVAVEAGMGHMGVHRNVIHPRFGNFVLLETLLIDTDVDLHGRPLDYNPCLSCNLCVAACPVGAIHPDGSFDGFACLDHNYREFLSGFDDWVDTIAVGTDGAGYHAKFDDAETLSMWQSLAFGPNYKSAYCMAVCPAGSDVISPYLADRARHRREVLVPLVRKPEPVYVRSGTRAEHVARRNPAKRVRYVDCRPAVSTPANLALGVRHRFSADLATGVRTRVAFVLPDGELTVTIAGGSLDVAQGIAADPDATVTCPDRDYIGILRRPRRDGADGGAPRFAVEGDAAALDRLLACLA